MKRKTFFERLNGALPLSPEEAEHVRAGVRAAIKAAIEGTQKNDQIDEEEVKGLREFLSTVKRRVKAQQWRNRK